MFEAARVDVVERNVMFAIEQMRADVNKRRQN
jgi:hypothetical protein